MDFNKLIARIKNILLTPQSEWPVIAAEPDSVAGLYKNYILILAAIPAVIGFLTLSRYGVGVGLSYLILTYIISLAVTFIVALIVDALAPSFGGQKNQTQALKVVAYSYTASWVASIATLIPLLGWLVALAAGIYGIYLMYLGLPATMKCPPEKAPGYTAVSVIIAILLSWILFIMLGSVLGIGAFMGGARSFSSIHSPTAIDTDKTGALGALAAIGQQAEIASKKMEAAQKSGDANAQAAAAGQMIGAVLGGGSQVDALAPEALKPFVPDTLAGLPRTSFSVQKQAPLGVQVSVAEASYRNASGGPSYELTVTDMGGAKGLMALAGFANVEEEKQSGGGFEKTYHEGGRLIHEEWNNSGNGEYTMIVADRFIVAVKGSGVANLDAIKAALGTINLSGLEALKTQGIKNG